MGKETEVNSKNCHNCPIRTNDEYGNNICGLVLNLSIDLEVKNDTINSDYSLKKKTIYFQPKGIKPKYCEAGMIHESDPEYIWYLDEPCKISLSEVEIIPKENVTYDKKSRSYVVKQSCL